MPSISISRAIDLLGFSSQAPLNTTFQLVKSSREALEAKIICAATVVL